jgi:hypothetical protein
MSLVPLTLGVIGRALTSPAGKACASRRVLSLGYPDILASRGQVAQIYGASIAQRLRVRDDAESILRWHNVVEPEGKEVIDAVSLFEALGFELDVVDIVEARGGEIIANLNEPLPESLHARYAAVLDAGTMEHCFNIAQAAKNIASAVALGGFVMHGNPLNIYNHGFYNLNPTWYHDFYAANGFAIEQLDIVVDAVNAPKVGKAPPTQRFLNMPDGATLLALARRTEIRAFVWPTQSKYQNNPTLRA